MFQRRGSSLLVFIVCVLKSCLLVLSLQCNVSATWYKWASNADDEDPCQVAAALYSMCTPSSAPLQPLVYAPDSPTFYSGPSIASQSQCGCSFVMYNLLAACGDCQIGHEVPTAWLTYADWASSCGSSNQSGVFPNSIPSSMAASVAQWARITTQDSGDPRWSYGLSHAIASGHVIINTAVIPSSSFSSCPSHTISPGLPVGTAFAGLAAGVLLAGIFFFFVRRRQARIIPTPTRYHTTEHNTPLQSLAPRTAYTSGANWVRQMLNMAESSGHVEPYDVSTFSQSPTSSHAQLHFGAPTHRHSGFPPHPAVSPLLRHSHVMTPGSATFESNNTSFSPSHSKRSSGVRPMTSASRLSTRGSEVAVEMLPREPSSSSSPFPVVIGRDIASTSDSRNVLASKDQPPGYHPTP